MRSLFLACIFTVVICPLAAAEEPPPPPPPSQDDIELAKSHYKTGELYYSRKDFPAAAHEFEEAYRLTHRAELLYNMGRSYDGNGDHARALAVYRRFLAQVSSSPDRPEVIDRVKHLADLIGRITLKASVDGSTVLVDGAPAGVTPLPEQLALNPGGHKIEVAHEGYATWRSDLVAAPGEDRVVSVDQISLVKVIRVEVPRQEKKVPLYKKWWLWTIVGGVVVAGAVAGGVLASQQPPVNGPFAQLPAVR